MADLARIKRNVAKMVGAGAPENEIDAYIEGEGVTVADVQSFKPSGLSRVAAGEAVTDDMRSSNVVMAGEPTKNPIEQFNEFSNSVQAGFNQGLTFGFGDELFAGVTAPFAAIGPALGGEGYDLGKAFNSQLDMSRRITEEQKGANPIASAVGEVTGAIVNPLSRISGGPVKSAVTGAGLGSAYGFGTGETMDERMSGAGMGAVTGGVVGAVAPAVTGWLGNALTRRAQRSATNAAIKNAPSAADLKSAGTAMFQQLDQSGVMVSGDRFGNMALELLRKFVKMRANPKLDPKATAALEDLVLAANEAQKAGTGITLSDLHTLRQIAQKAAQSSEGRDQMFSTQIINSLDDMIATLKPADMVGGADPGQTVNLMFDAMGTWARSKRAGIIEQAIEQAQNAKSGFENGLRIEFGKLLKPNMRKQFTPPELQAIEEVVRGSTAANLTKLLGKFGFDTNNMLGGTVGGLFGGSLLSGGDPLGGVALAAAGTVSRRAAEALTKKAADRAARVVATPGIPSVAAGPKTLAAQEALRRLGIAGVPAVANSKPWDITVRGGN